MSNRDGSGTEYQELKFTIHRKLIDRRYGHEVGTDVALEVRKIAISRDSRTVRKHRACVAPIAPMFGDVVAESHEKVDEGMMHGADCVKGREAGDSSRNRKTIGRSTSHGDGSVQTLSLFERPK